MYPSFQANKMQPNNRMENPTRKANALAMWLVLAFPLRPSFIMKNSAEPRLARMATKAIANKYVIG